MILRSCLVMVFVVLCICLECMGVSLSRKTSLDGSIELSNHHDEQYTVSSAGYLKGDSWFPLETPDGFNSNAVAISYDGMTIAGLVGRRKASGLSEIYTIRWDYDASRDLHGMEILTPAIQYDKSHMVNMSDNGEYVVGYFEQEDASVYSEGYRWDRNGAVHLLGSVSSQFTSAAAYDVSDSGIIVGMEIDAYGQFATIWDETHGMRDLREVLMTEYGYDYVGWRLSDARYISPDGTYVFGSGFDPEGRNVEWEAVVPEPGTVVLLGLGALVLRRKK